MYLLKSQPRTLFLLNIFCINVLNLFFSSRAFNTLVAASRIRVLYMSKSSSSTPLRLNLLLLLIMSFYLTSISQSCSFTRIKSLLKTRIVAALLAKGKLMIRANASLTFMTSILVTRRPVGRIATSILADYKESTQNIINIYNKQLKQKSL